jgi:hypothetical protein
MPELPAAQHEDPRRARGHLRNRWAGRSSRANRSRATLQHLWRGSRPARRACSPVTAATSGWLQPGLAQPRPGVPRRHAHWFSTDSPPTLPDVVERSPAIRHVAQGKRRTGSVALVGGVGRWRWSNSRRVGPSASEMPSAGTGAFVASATLDGATRRCGAAHCEDNTAGTEVMAPSLVGGEACPPRLADEGRAVQCCSNGRPPCWCTARPQCSCTQRGLSVRRPGARPMACRTFLQGVASRPPKPPRSSLP